MAPDHSRRRHWRRGVAAFALVAILALSLWLPAAVVPAAAQDNDGDQDPTAPDPNDDPPAEPGDDEPPLVRFEVVWTVELQSTSYGGSAAADIDGDGKLEVVFGTYYNDEHIYALNGEDGSIVFKHASDGGPLDASVALADVDGDGALEILTADSAYGTVYCLDGAGELEWSTRLPSGTDSPIAVADLEGDGDIELVVGTMMTGSERNGAVVVLDPITQEVVWEVAVPGHIQSEPALVDLTRDGVLDVVVTTWYGDHHVRALDGRSGTELWRVPMKTNMYHGVTVVQHEGQQWLAATSTDGDLKLIDEKGEVVWEVEVGGYVFAPTAAADLDGDGRPEIIAVNDRLHAYTLDGELLWRSVETDASSSARGVAIADLDGDGHLDLVFCCNDRFVRVVDGVTGKLWAEYDATIRTAQWESIDHGPVVADLDGDGALEIFFVGGLGHSTNEGRDNFGRATCLRLTRGDTPATPNPLTEGGPSNEWLTFRGNLQRTGTATPPDRLPAEEDDTEEDF